MAIGGAKADGQNRVIGLESFEPEPGSVPSARGFVEVPRGSGERPHPHPMIVILSLDGSQAASHRGRLRQCTGALDAGAHLVGGGGSREVLAALGLGQLLVVRDVAEG